MIKGIMLVSSKYNMVRCTLNKKNAQDVYLFIPILLNKENYYTAV